MNFSLYPIFGLARAGDDESFDLRTLPFEILDRTCIEDTSGRFRRDAFNGFEKIFGTQRTADLKCIRYAIVQRSQVERADQTINILAACLRLIRPMRNRVLKVGGLVREEDGTFDVKQIDLPAPSFVDLPDVQKLFTLRNQDAESLRAYAPGFQRAMRGEFWKFRMGVQFHELGHFQTLDWRARFLLWCSAIESIYTSHHRNHKGSLVAKARIRWFIGEDTSIYAPGDLPGWVPDPHITIGHIVGGLYDVRNYLAHGDKLPDDYFRHNLRSGVTDLEVFTEGASFIVRTSLLKILRDNLLDHFADAGSAEAFFGKQGLTLSELRDRQS